MTSRGWAGAVAALVTAAVGCERFHVVGGSQATTPSDAAAPSSAGPPGDAGADTRGETVPQPPAPMPGPDASDDGPPDAPPAQVDPLLGHARIYMVMTGSLGRTDVVLIDVDQGRTVASATINGVITLARHGDAILALRAYGYQRISVLDPATLKVVDNFPLPFDPIGLASSPDGRFVYTAENGKRGIAQIRMADGVVTATTQFPDLPGRWSLTSYGYWLGVYAAGTRLAAAAQQTFEPTEVGNTVAVFSVIEGSMKLVDRWQISTIQPGCGGGPTYPAFVAENRIVTFDFGCGAFEAYDLMTGARDADASATFRVPICGSDQTNPPIIDGMGQFWSSTCDGIYRARLGHPSAVTIPNPETGHRVLVRDSKGSRIFAFSQGPPDGPSASRIDEKTGALTSLAWDLSLIPSGSYVTDAIFVAH